MSKKPLEKVAFNVLQFLTKWLEQSKLQENLLVVKHRGNSWLQRLHEKVPLLLAELRSLTDTDQVQLLSERLEDTRSQQNC